MEKNFNQSAIINTVIQRFNAVSRETFGADVSQHVISINPAKPADTTVLAITPGTVITWRPGFVLSAEQVETLRRGIYAPFQTPLWKYEHSAQYDAAVNKVSEVLDITAADINCQSYGRISGAELLDKATHAWFAFGGQRVPFDIRALRAVLGAGFGYIAKFNGLNMVVVSESYEIGQLVFYMIPDAAAPIQAPVLSVHYPTLAPLNTVDTSALFPDSGRVHIGYHNAEQMRQCPWQARDKFMAAKFAGRAVPHSSKRDGNNPRVLRQALSHADADLGLSVLDWYQQTCYNPDAGKAATLARLGRAIAGHLRDIESNILIARPSNWFRVSEPLISVPIEFMSGRPEFVPPYGDTKYDLTVAPDCLWMNEKRQVVMAEIKATSSSISREFYKQESDQLLWYSQILTAAGYEVLDAFWIITPDPSAVDAFGGLFPICETVAANLKEGCSKRDSWNTQNWRACFKMLSATPESQVKWEAHPNAGWCRWCDTKTTCPLIKAGCHPYLN